MRSFLALTHISFYNIIRQSFFSIILLGAYLFILSSPAFTMFTLMNAKKLILDMGMATILIAELGISVLATYSTVGGEVEERTSTLLLSKPISRFTFLSSKIFAVSLSLLFSLIPLVSCLIMTLKMGVPEAAYSKVEYSILWFEFLPLILAAFIAGISNYYADKNFGSTFIISMNISIIFSLFLLYFLEKGKLPMNLFLPAFFLWMAGVIISPISSLFSLRGNIFFTLTFSFFVFVLGLVSDYIFHKFLHNPGIKVVYSLLPNFRVFWLEDIWAKGKSISLRYFIDSFTYMLLYTSGVTFLGWSIWERREISGGRQR